MKRSTSRYGIAGKSVTNGKRVWLTERRDWYPDAKQARTWATLRGATAALARLRADGEALPSDHVAEVKP